MFSPDSKFMQILTRITDLILLNIVYLIFCLPVFTIGAATTALYTLCFRMMREEDNGVIRPFFRAFRDNFKPATLLWAAICLVVLPALYYFDRAFHAEGLLRAGCVLFFLIAAVGLLTASYGFPWLSQFQNSVPQTLLNSLILSITNLPRSVCILGIHLLPVILWAVNYDLFAKVSFLWLTLYFAAAAYMNAGLLWHVFKPYRNP